MKKFRGLGILIFLAVFAATTALVMLLWNSVAVHLFAVPTVNFWYAAGLIILSKLLFGGFKNAHDYFHTHRAHLSRRGGHRNGKQGPWGDRGHDHLMEMHEIFHSMSGRERREYIRNHMASAFHGHGPQGCADGSENGQGEEGQTGTGNGSNG
ncbi:MAG: hypothetical protein LUE10_01570 [Alistipes sp.]|nr:hypothetical protein [Alistipes sp.]